MRVRCWAVVLVILALVSGTVSAGSLDAVEERLVSKTLPNGLHVTILPMPESPVVATQVWVHVGSANEDEHSRGFAHLFEHLMFGGTASHSKMDYWKIHERYGGDNNAYTAFDETVYISEIPPEGHEQVLAMEADRLAHLALTEENLANEKKIVTEELRLRTENDPLARVMITAFKRVLGDHPYGPTPIGTKEDIARADLEECRRFYHRYYNASNAHLVIVGPVDPAETLARVVEYFGPLPGGEGPPPDVPELLSVKRPEGVIELKEDLPPAEVAIFVWPLPAPGDREAAAIEMMETMLTRSAVDPFEEILVRERRKAVYSESFDYPFRRGRALVLDGAFLPHYRRKTALRRMDEAVAQLGRFDWLTEEKLASAKRKLLLGEMQSTYSPAYLAGALGRARWWRGDERAAFERIRQIEAVTADQVKAVYKKYVASAKPTKLYLKPRHIPLYVRLFGWLYPLFQR